MKFTLTFRCIGNLVDSADYKKGYKFIDAIANQYNFDPVNLKCIKRIAAPLNNSLNIDIDNYNAIKAIPLFNTNNDIIVTVQGGFLKKYIKYDIEKWWSVDGYKIGPIWMPIIKRLYNVLINIDTDQLIKDWSAAEFPLSWNVIELKREYKLVYYNQAFNKKELDGVATSFQAFLSSFDIDVYDKEFYNRIIDLKISEVEDEINVI